MDHFLLSLTSHQACPQLSPFGLLGLDRSPNPFRFLRPHAQIFFHLDFVPEIPGEDRVHVRQSEGVVTLDDSLGSRSVFKGVYDALEQYARAGNAQSALSIVEQWNGNRLNGHVHNRSSRIGGPSGLVHLRQANSKTQNERY
jgi:hypothetical protein